MNISSGPNTVTRQPQLAFPFFSQPDSTTQTAAGSDPVAGVMGLCLQCMAHMAALLGMTLGQQGMAGGGNFGSGQSSPGMDSFLGGGASPMGSGSGGASPMSSGAGGGASSMADPSGGSSEASSASGASGATGQSEPAPDWAQKLPEPLRALGPAFEKYGKQYKVDPRFLAAISMLETGGGTSKAFKNKKNAMGVSDSKGPIGFSAPEESIERMARVLASDTGPYKGARTIQQIGKIYAPPGAGNDPNGTNGHWPTGVSKFFQQLGGDPSQPVK